MSAKPKIRAPYWRQAEIDRAKAAVKLDLERQPDHAARLKHANNQINVLADDLKPKTQLLRLIYIVSALVHHERHGSLSGLQIRRLSQVASTILRVMRVRSGDRVAAGFYRDLHTALSQASRRHGKHWDAAWHHHLAQALGPKNPGGFSLLVRGNRQLRLGDAPYAIQQFIAAEESGLDAESLARARFERVRALRLTGELEHAAAVAHFTAELPHLSAAQRQELAWENLCRDAQSTGNLQPLLNAVKAKGTHPHPSYVIEAVLWCFASPQKNWVRAAPRLQRLSRGGATKIPGLAPFLSIARTLEASYDKSVPFALRLANLGQALTLTAELVTVDKELLVWASAYRWLLRNKARDLAVTAAFEYQSLSSRLTAGKSLDALSLRIKAIQTQLTSARVPGKIQIEIAS